MGKSDILLSGTHLGPIYVRRRASTKDIPRSPIIGRYLDRSILPEMTLVPYICMSGSVFHTVDLGVTLPRYLVLDPNIYRSLSTQHMVFRTLSSMKQGFHPFAYMRMTCSTDDWSGGTPYPT